MKLYIDCMIILCIFNTIVHSEMCEFKSIDENIYNDILFDRHYDNNPGDYIHINSIENRPPLGNPEYQIDMHNFSELMTKTKKEKYFGVFSYGCSSIHPHCYLYVYKNFGILYTRPDNPNWYRDESHIFIHNLPNHILFVLKYTRVPNIVPLLDLYKTNPKYFNQNYSASYNICKSKINIMVENRSNEIVEVKIKELITIILYSFVLGFIIIIFSIIIFNYIYKKQREIIFYEI
jgi:hypothetical protein